MSEQKLNLTHKLFALLESMVSQLVIHEVDLSMPLPVLSLALTMPAGARELDFTVGTSVTELAVPEFSITVCDAVGEFERPTIQGGDTAAPTTVVLDEPLSGYSSPAVQAMDPEALYAKVHDFEQTVAPLRFKARCVVHELKYVLDKPLLYALKIEVPARVADATASALRLTVKKSPLNLLFLSQGEQLAFWKKALLQTRKEARKLDLLGIYPGVPYAVIERMRIDNFSKRLTFNFQSEAERKALVLHDIAVFNDLETMKAVIVIQ